MRAHLATEACGLELGRELGGVARCPGMGLDEDLVDTVPGGAWRAEDRGALGAFDVDLHDDALSAVNRGSASEGVRERDHVHLLGADLVLPRTPPAG